VVGEAEVVEVVEAEVEAEEVAVGGGDEGVAEKGGGRRQGGREGGKGSTGEMRVRTDLM